MACRGGGGGWRGVSSQYFRYMIQPTVPLDLAGNGGMKEHLSALDYEFTFYIYLLTL